MLSKTVVPFLALGSASLVSALDPVAIVGVPVQNGAAPIRRNIDDLASEAGPQWDLYLQSLTAMYEAESSDALSFFQVAGIHGWPFVEWNGTGAGDQSNGWKGYCPHGESIFLPWHRPYVVLFEQTLVGHAMQIAAKYPDPRRNEYTEAAATLRAPYWDWATARAIPEATVPESVTVTTAEGKKQIKNPLSSYSYPQEALQGQYGDMNRMRPEARQQKATYRCASPQSYPDSANDALSLRKNQIRTNDLRAMLYDVFTNSRTYAQFASTGERGSSLEQIHSSIHVEAACGADMLNPHVSGFDPLFMLHHANVDRLWAYWQAMKPDEANLSGSYAGRARFTTPNRANIGPDSPLEPFRGQGGRPHTPNTVALIRDFGYSYEGLEDGKPKQQLIDDATRLINKLYSRDSPPEGAPSTVPRPSSKPDGPRTSGSPGSPRSSGNPESTRSSENTESPRSSGNPESPRTSGSSVGPRPSGNPDGSRSNGNPESTRSSENTESPRPSGSPVDPRPSENPVDPRPIENPVDPRPSGNPGGPRSSGNPESPRTSGSPVGPRPSGNPESPRPSGNPRPGINGTIPGVPPSGSNPDGPPGNNPKSPRPSDDPDDADQGNRPDGSRPSSPLPSNSPNGSRPGNPLSGGSPNRPDSGGTDDGVRHYAQIQLDVEHVERPCFINVYVGNIHAGSMVVMAQPAEGNIYGAVSLSRAIQDFANQPTNGTSPEFKNNIHADITKPNGERIELGSVTSLKIEVDQVNVSPPTSDNKLPKVEFKDPEPVNGGRELTPPPAAARTEYGPRIDGGGRDGGSGEGGHAGNKPKYGPSSAAARSGPIFGFILALFAMISLPSMF
ncbi:tyrosinase 2 [Ophiocordyceps sinensis CO18]|uniref:Tyrosinase 2 n=1 Tax=Ophiocordyceps sinensis (strain Co18 / CGMCC 3.14243) TaxID=911162 RepID=T5ANU5_OPHSC|nr:tyrosinase 2 [Ophiocordyceps sinensis CO18]